MSKTEVITEINLALHGQVTCSSESSNGTGHQAVDGALDTCWQPSSSDRREDNRVWITVDLGDCYAFNVVQLKLASGFIHRYQILYSTDGEIWSETYSRETSRGGIHLDESALFPKVRGRYVTLEVELFDPERDFQLIELGVYERLTIPSGPLLDRLVCTVEGSAYDQDDTLTVQVNKRVKLNLRGMLTDGSNVYFDFEDISISCSHEDVVTIDENWVINSLKSGISQIKISVTLDGVMKEASFFIDVSDPTEWLVDINMVHPSLVMDIGQPAYLELGCLFPYVHVKPTEAMKMNVSLVNMTLEQLVDRHSEINVASGMASVITFPGEVRESGKYRISIVMEIEGDRFFYDAFYFTVKDPHRNNDGQSEIVHIDEKGKLAYVPDYKGNQILDFSNCGYGGGGVALPDVETVIVLEPVEGDNTTHIQAAIDQIADLPLSVLGFRGAVLLKKGVYPIGGTLQIHASGIVVRGEGESEDGTLLFATGTTQRNVIEIRGESVPCLLPDTQTSICDLYVPTGARTIHVSDASCYRVGDTVKVLRYGNERWIHAIGMDAIRLRPIGGGTVQWLPFQLEFDRVVTHIDGNCVTLDAPIANAIESCWGGGSLIKFADTCRIEQIGIEYLRVVVSYDSTIQDSRIDGNEGSESYLADEQHAINFIDVDNVKNAWIRNVVGFHLQHALVQVGRSAKWITIQDCAAYDFVSVITGGRRYAFHLMGELTLVQRAFTETARHAFVVDARVAGPNVFLDCESQEDYNSSEPHHRWSVGCLYDNVMGRIHIQDRGWLGSGHGWSGANYVTWNTSNELVSQQPPTAQNYAIGHVGTQGKSLLPSPYDQRQRKEAYWESFGSHVTPRSLYTQQLLDRLMMEACVNKLPE
ncbi:discoidin domain-containing protein [Paenibacillus qinlingensis]|uniref:F5/8 type C domain-containing protein n=1 Tax=Paenibacillus qinlingensis TaxID=1837343 RepID=A0ABU1NQQ4_9BACL|nr:discoidin domain-containing protein [Paenibacillus qinlingensis]MDR6549217.1 hypothetical protein [Paenibacillus qinlingensis]